MLRLRLTQVLLEPSHVNGASELDGTATLVINVGDVVEDGGSSVLGVTGDVISGFLSLRIELVDANSGVERVLDGVRVLLLDHNGEVVGFASVNLGVRLEGDRIRGIVEEQELGVLVSLLVHVANVDLWNIVALRIGDSWQLVLEYIIDCNLETSLWFCHEIWIVIRHDFNIKIHLKKTVEAITGADDGLLDTDLIISVGLDVDGILLSVENGKTACILTILVDDIGGAAHQGDGGSRVLSVDVVRHGVLTTVVLDTGEILGGESAGSGDLHGVEKSESARVARGVRGEPVVLRSLLDQSVLLGEGVEAI